MRSLLLVLLAFFCALPLRADVVRLAPDFAIPTAGKSRSLRSLRGQSVVLLVTRSPKEGAFKKQLKYLQEIYQQFASKEVIFVAALLEGEGPIQSNIPFSVAANASAVAAAYGVTEDFTIAIIGRDGNIDYQTTKVLTPERVRDVIQNSFSIQSTARKL